MTPETARLRLKSALDRCARHAARLTVAQDDLRKLGPLDASRLANPSKEEADRIDLLLLSYMRLQDALGGQLFPALLEAGGDLSAESGYIDRLNQLERLGIVESTEKWLELRAIRNQLTHDYPDPEVRLQILNSTIDTIQNLQRTLSVAKAYAEQKLKL